MPEEGKALAPAQPSAVMLGGNLPEGFENLEAKDLVVPRIRLWHPQSDVSPDGVKMGDYVDLMAKKSIGPTLNFFVIAQKTVEYERTDDKTGTKTIREEKHFLAVLEGDNSFPRRIELSAAGIQEAKRLISHLFVSSQQKGNVPLYSWLIKATSENLTNKDNGGKYSAPLFEVVRESTPEELAMLKQKHTDFASDFLKKKETAHDAAPAAPSAKAEDIPFGAGEEKKA